MTTETHTPERATPETERVKTQSLGCTLARALGIMSEHAENLERQRDELLEALEASLSEHEKVLGFLQERTNEGESVEHWMSATRERISSCRAAIAKATTNTKQTLQP